MDTDFVMGVLHEALHHHPKPEIFYLNAYDSIYTLKEDLSRYFYFYNYERFHQTLGYKKPMEVHNKKQYDQVTKRSSDNSNSSEALLQKAA